MDNKNSCDLMAGFVLQIFDKSSKNDVSVVALTDRKGRTVSAVAPEHLSLHCESLRFNSWLHIPFHSIRIKGRMTFKEGPEKHIMFLLHPDGKLKTIFFKS